MDASNSNALNWQGHWIWTSEALPERNASVRFLRTFHYSGGPAMLHLTADSRYTLWLNGRFLGFGPVRAWPNHWRYDSYDLAPELREGENVLAVLVNHPGEGNFQYLPRPAGLLAQLELSGETVVSDASWLAAPAPAWPAVTPRISCQEPFEEHFDARLDDGWLLPGYDASGWTAAELLRPALDGIHNNLQPRGIPFLTQEPVLPQRLVAVESVRSLPHRFTLAAKPYLLPEDIDSNFCFYHAYLATQIWSAEEADVRFVIPHFGPGELKVNGEPQPQPDEDGKRWVHLNAGWNQIVFKLPNPHLVQFVVTVDGPETLRFRAGGAEGSSDALWAIVGPFAFSAEEEANIRYQDRTEAIAVAAALHVSATPERGTTFWNEADVRAVQDEVFFQPVRTEHLPPDAFVQSYTDAVVSEALTLENEAALFSGADWVTVHPSPSGADVRLLLDWGKEVIGFHHFEVHAAAGTVLDWHNFEFIQPDGRFNLAEGMNNATRYICREGRQEYQTLQRRGFGYSYLTLRNMTGPVRLRGVQVLFSTYPQTRRGHFACSDSKLNRIWEVGAHTLRCCAEDTYTDCPTYEQTHWVGDARNEALVDYAINGDPRLWFRCLQQTGQSLERSPLVESQVPSAWEILLPAWSFLWMRSCREYALFTGDRAGSRELLAWIERNVQGIVQHINDQGLFEIRAWNMFDWAAMDTPAHGTVTHNNCFAVHALRDVAELADWLGEPGLATEWRILAASLSTAINSLLWNEDKGAYTDCLRGTEQSAVYSQQTQTVAVMSGVAADHSAARAEQCRLKMHHPPADFVHAGSPFFEFFLLEAYALEGRDQEFLDTIRRDWGFMIDKGATTFWEMWSNPGGRLTRSHCHGWSAAPTFFLTSQVLGVRPGSWGWDSAIVEPHPGDLTWCRGRVPTPHGDIEVQWENEPAAPLTLRIQAPENVAVDVRMEGPGRVTINGVEHL